MVLWIKIFSRKKAHFINMSENNVKVLNCYTLMGKMRQQQAFFQEDYLSWGGPE